MKLTKVRFVSLAMITHTQTDLTADSHNSNKNNNKNNKENNDTYQIEEGGLRVAASSSIPSWLRLSGTNTKFRWQALFHMAGKHQQRQRQRQQQQLRRKQQRQLRRSAPAPVPFPAFISHRTFAECARIFPQFFVCWAMHAAPRGQHIKISARYLSFPLSDRLIKAKLNQKLCLKSCGSYKLSSS